MHSNYTVVPAMNWLPAEHGQVAIGGFNFSNFKFQRLHFLCHFLLWYHLGISLSAFISRANPFVLVSSGNIWLLSWISWLPILDRIPPQPKSVWQFLLLFSNPDL
ncbi:hypothetical protein SUGI_0378490 [Cryptomeria japonica]|nr:hypothetical protein SUGI_0378490 [Cryptomeria japonica]